MNRQEAHAKWSSLRNMTIERGCTEHEADTAAKLAARLDAMYGFTAERASSSTRPMDDRLRRWQEYVRRTQAGSTRATREAKQEWTRDYEQAKAKFKWEGRRCGKALCWCMRTGGYHGPYKYGKTRYGFKNRRVKSVYMGFEGRSGSTNKRS